MAGTGSALNSSIFGGYSAAFTGCCIKLTFPNFKPLVSSHFLHSEQSTSNYLKRQSLSVLNPLTFCLNPVSPPNSHFGHLIINLQKQLPLLFLPTTLFLFLLILLLPPHSPIPSTCSQTTPSPCPLGACGWHKVVAHRERQTLFRTKIKSMNSTQRRRKYSCQSTSLCGCSPPAPACLLSNPRHTANPLR